MTSIKRTKEWQQENTDSHGLTGISLNFDPALKVLKLILVFLWVPEDPTENNGGYQAMAK